MKRKTDADPSNEIKRQLLRILFNRLLNQFPSDDCKWYSALFRVVNKI